METNNIPTSEELFKEYSNNTALSEGHYEYLMDKEDFVSAFNEGVKRYVKAALEEASKKAKIKSEYYHEDDCGRTKLREILDSSQFASERTDGDGLMYAVDTYEIDKDSILNAYPLDNIK